MAPRNEEPSGVLVIDKPPGVTSHDVVDVIRKAGRLAKVGHTGTLDPFATGVLPLCINRATRLAAILTEGDKAYRGTARLGVSTTTQDYTGAILEERPIPEALDLELLRATARSFLGDIVQRPPMFSAVRVAGQRLYELARQGIEVDRPERPARVDRFEILGFDGQSMELEVAVSKGTYVRTLASDLGDRVGCGAHLTALCRTAAGAFRLEQAVSLEVAAEAARQGALEPLLVPLSQVLPELPAVEVRGTARVRVLNGGSLRAGEIEASVPLREGSVVRILSEGELLSLAVVAAGGEDARAASPDLLILKPRTVVAAETAARSRGHGRAPSRPRPAGG